MRNATEVTLELSQTGWIAAQVASAIFLAATAALAFLKVTGR